MSKYFNILQGGFVHDPWSYVGDDDAIDEGAQVIVTLARWRAEADAICDTAQLIGVVVEPEHDLDPKVDRLKALSLISIVFPKFTDGRGYSHARRLRDQLGFEGEVRACGEVLVDQIPLMMRCGIDALEVSHAPTIEALEAGTLPGIVLGYQAPIGKRFGRVQRHKSGADV